MLIEKYFFIVNGCLWVDIVELIKSCEILTDEVVAKVNMIVLGMYDIVVLRMDCFAKKIVFSK